MTGQYGGGGGTPAGMVQLQSRVLAAPAASITFSTISQLYTSLRVLVQARTDRAAQVFEGVDLQFNNDTGANYDSQQADISGATGTWSSLDVLAGIAAQCASVTGAAAAAALAASFEVVVPNYAAVVFNKQFTSFGHVKYGVASANIHTVLYSGDWRNTAAVTALTFLTRNGSNFVVGTTATLYGVL